MKSLLVVSGLVVLGVAGRLLFASVPNFAPVASLALFAGYVLTERRWALAVPFCVMAVTDQLLGGYQGLLMLVVYGSLGLPAFWGHWARSRWEIRGEAPARAAAHAMRLTGLGLGSSLLFFATTNLATWWVTDWYAKTLSGLALCFLRGLEFFRYTLAGDLAFALVLFGTYAVAKVCLSAIAPLRVVSS